MERVVTGQVKGVLITTQIVINPQQPTSGHGQCDEMLMLTDCTN